jgi:hypothetical protein
MKHLQLPSRALDGRAVVYARGAVSLFLSCALVANGGCSNSSALRGALAASPRSQAEPATTTVSTASGGATAGAPTPGSMPSYPVAEIDRDIAATSTRSADRVSANESAPTGASAANGRPAPIVAAAPRAPRASGAGSERDGRRGLGRRDGRARAGRARARRGRTASAARPAAAADAYADLAASDGARASAAAGDRRPRDAAAARAASAARKWTGFARES